MINYSPSKFISMTDLLEMKFFILLSKTSPTVTNTEMQNAYGEFIKHIITTSNSKDYSSVFRNLSFIRIETIFIKESYQYRREKKHAQNALYT